MDAFIQVMAKSLPLAAASGRRASTRSAAQSPIPRKERLRNTGRAILASAVDQFSRRGFEGASLREIAAAAGVQHGMIRHIYQTKEELWRQAIAFLFERMESELPRELLDMPEEDAAGRFRLFVYWYVDYCARHPEHARLMVQQSILEGPDMEWAVDRFIRTRHGWHRPFIERLQESGDLPKVDPTAIFMMITASCQMPYLLAPEIAAVTGRNVFSDEERKAHADAVVAVFLRRAA